MDKSKTRTGLAIASAAAVLFLAGCTSTGATHTAAAEDGGVKIKCFGSNACKGHGECKSAMNACKGHNECKGQSFEMMTEKACVERLGRA